MCAGGYPSAKTKVPSVRGPFNELALEQFLKTLPIGSFSTAIGLYLESDKPNSNVYSSNSNKLHGILPAVADTYIYLKNCGGDDEVFRPEQPSNTWGWRAFAITHRGEIPGILRDLTALRIVRNGVLVIGPECQGQGFKTYYDACVSGQRQRANEFRYASNLGVLPFVPG